MNGPGAAKSLAGLIQRAFQGMGIGAEASPEGKLAESSDPDGLPAGLVDGVEEMGEEGLLLRNLGFTRTDRRSEKRNVSEQANIEQFLQAEGKELALSMPEEVEVPSVEHDAFEGEVANEQEQLRETKEERAAFAEAREIQEGFEGVSLKEEAPAEQDGGDSQSEGGKEGEEQDEDERPGAAWLAEELDEREKKKKRDADGAEVFADVHRCRGTLEDGSRCLRKAQDGTPYCQIHRTTSD